MAENVEAAGAGKESEGRRRRPMEVPAELDSRFLRVGDKLYRSAHDKQPVATITPDRIKAGLDVLRSMNSLRELDVTFREPKRLAPAEFWRQHATGAFNKPSE